MSAKDVNDFLKRSEKLGWQVKKTGGGHVSLTHEHAKNVVFGPSTPSDHRSLLNLGAQLKRELKPVTPATTGITGFLEPSGHIKKKKKISSSNSGNFKNDYDIISRRHYVPLDDRKSDLQETAFTEAVAEPIDKQDYLLAWKIAVYRLRTMGRDWDAIRPIKHRFRNDEAFVRDSIQNLQSTGQARFTQLRHRFLVDLGLRQGGIPMVLPTVSKPVLNLFPNPPINNVVATPVEITADTLLQDERKFRQQIEAKLDAANREIVAMRMKSVTFLEQQNQIASLQNDLAVANREMTAVRDNSSKSVDQYNAITKQQQQINILWNGHAVAHAKIEGLKSINEKLTQQNSALLAIVNALQKSSTPNTFSKVTPQPVAAKVVGVTAKYRNIETIEDQPVQWWKPKAQ